jgi:hypothetical protein
VESSDESILELASVHGNRSELVFQTPVQRKFVNCIRPSSVTANWLASKTVSPRPNWEEAVLASAAAP